MLSKNQELIHKIERAFKSTNHPDLKIGDMEEVGHLRHIRWQEATIGDLQRVGGLMFFSIEGFYYYLPAYLISLLRDPKQLGTQIIPKLFTALHNASPSVMTRKQRRELLSKQKTAVIIEFLEQMRETSFIDEPFGYMEKTQVEIKEHIDYTLQDWLEFAKAKP